MPITAALLAVSTEYSRLRRIYLVRRQLPISKQVESLVKRLFAPWYSPITQEQEYCTPITAPS